MEWQITIDGKVYDGIIGDRNYDSNNIISDNEPIADSLNKIANYLNTEDFVEKRYYPAWQDFTVVGTEYYLTLDQNATSNFTIDNLNRVATDILDFSVINPTNRNLMYKSGSLLNINSNVVRVLSFDYMTGKVTLNFTPKNTFRINYLCQYANNEVPIGKKLEVENTEITVQNSDDASEIAYNNSTSALTSTDVQSAIDEVNNDLSDHIGDIANPHSVTKSQVGLGNVDNTSDVTKMIVSNFVDLDTSDKTIVGAINEHESDLIALDGRVDILTPKVTTLENKTSNIDNTSDLNKPISTPTQTALDTKQDNLVSGTNIKTINGQSVLGSGDIVITGGGGSGGGYFTGTAGITVGGITTGDTFTDVPVTDMINNLINPELTPNLTNPNNVLTSTVSGLREIGTSITPRLTATFNRGSISPQYSASEPYRAGLPTKYVFTSTAGLNQEVETDATTYGIDVSSFEVALGTVTFSSNISYSAGPQPTTSKGNVFDNPLPAGTTGNKTVTITGVYPCYNGISTLTKMTLANHGGIITVDAPADMNVGGERFKIQYPTVWSAKTPVVQQENELSKAWDNQNMSDYSITTIDKNGVSYKQVEYVGAGIGARKLRLVF